MDVVNLIEKRPDITPMELAGPWRVAFNRICSELGFDKRSTKILWTFIGVHDNWDHLHESNIERRMTASEWLDWFSSDLFYCSDRWSFDRMLRVQWTFRHWEKAWHYEVNGPHWFDPIE